MKVVKLEIKGFKGIAKADIDLGDVNVVAGTNGSGKSSVLDAIAVALGGAAGLPEAPVKVGAESAEIVARLDDGMVIRRKIMPDRRMALAVEFADGKRPPKPQEFLDKLVGSGLALDPLEFCQSKPKVQADMLRSMVGLDTSDLDGKRAELYSERTVLGRQRDAAKGHADSLPFYSDAGDTERSSADVLEQMNAANRAERQRDMLLSKVERLRGEATIEQNGVADAQAALERVPGNHAAALTQLRIDMDAQEADLRESIAALQRKLEGLEALRKTRIQECDATHAAIAEGIAGQKAMHEAAAADLLQQVAEVEAQAEAVEVPDVTALQAQLADLDGYNRKVAGNKRRQEAQAAAEGLAEQYKALTAQIEQVDADKAARVAAIKWPVDGLGFGDDGTVTFRGVPLSQASQAEQLRTAMAIGLHTAGAVKMVLLREASLLDDGSRKMVCDLAREAGAQIVLEIVGAPVDDDGNCFLMVDGEVAYASAAG